MAKEDSQLFFYDQYSGQGAYRIGPRTSHSIRTDPRHLLFTLARYKFCAKMLEGAENVLEVGCGDGIGVPLILQTVKNLYAVDIDGEAIQKDIEYNEYATARVLPVRTGQNRGRRKNLTRFTVST